jgi:hypothetical protein
VAIIIILCDEWLLLSSSVMGGYDDLASEVSTLIYKYSFIYLYVSGLLSSSVMGGYDDHPSYS